MTITSVDRFEQTFGQSAYAHLFVTRAMRDHLVKDWDLQYVVFLLILQSLCPILPLGVAKSSFMIDRLVISIVPLRRKHMK